MADRIVAQLSADQAIQLWPRIETLLKPLLAIEGNWETVDVLAAHLKGEMVLWVSWKDDVEAVMVSTVINHPRRKVCHVPWIAGTNMAEWKDDFMEKIEAYAKSLGCSRMAGAMREGWVKVAGYRKAGVILYKDI